jgi:flavin-dependent dehydrogenase
VGATDTEVLIVGGGPAGAAAGTLLARWGHDVLLVTRAPLESEELALAESLTPSCGKMFDLLGLTGAIDGAGFIRSTGNTVWWGSDDPRVERFASDARGWQATSAVLERVMVDAASTAGARVKFELMTPEAARARPARFRIDATGRTGVLARRDAGRVYEPGHRTVALIAVWTHPSGWTVPDPTHTLLESYGDGWAWSVPVDEERRAVAVMVDPQATTLARGEGSRATYLAELEKTRRFRDLLTGATLVSGPTGRDASMYSSTAYGGRDWLVAGDAASFIDPLSSAGVKKALASGWLAAIVAHTALIKPEMAEVAVGFFAEREAEMYRNFLGLTRRFLREAAGGQAHPFWVERAEADQARDVQAQARREAELAQAAYDGIRAREELRLRPGETVRTERRPAVGGAEIVLEPRIVSERHPIGARYFHDVDVVTIVELAPAFRRVPDLYDAYVRRSGPVDLAAFLTALSTVVARGWLVAE